MRKIMILLSMISLTSCRSVERRLICAELKKQEIDPVEMCDINIKFDRCRCRMFDMNSWNALSEPINHPLSYCDGMAGYKLNDISLEIRPKVKAMYRLKANLCE